MADFTLNQEQYESLIAMARIGAGGDQRKLTELEAWLRLIEEQNGVTRDFVLVQWQELGQSLQAGQSFPANYPEELRRSIELVTRAVAKVDVDAVIDQYANDPTNVLVTRDPAGLVGWTPVDDFFVT